MKVTIDRFEGEFAVVLTENGKSVPVPQLLFDGGKEGDIFNIFRDDTQTKERGDRIKNLMDEVWE